MNALDLVVVAIIILSGLFAFARGFVKEALSIAGWFGAAFLALYALPYVRPFAEKFLPKGPAADGVGGFAVFVVALIILSLLTSAISRRVKASSLSALDRTFGLVFGLMRGALVVCLAYFALSWLLPPGGDQPRWMAESKTAPLLESGARAIAQLVPGTLRERAATLNPQKAIGDQVNSAIRAYALPNAGVLPNAGPVPAKPAGPSKKDQDGLDRLIDQAEH